MGGTATISVDEYLRTGYEPDREFVDGALVERNVGTQRHGLLQLIIGGALRQYRKSHRIQVFAAARLLVDASGKRYRIPDVLVLELPYHEGRVVVDPPAIVVEIKSPEDTFDDIVDKGFEYGKLGVANILVMDPERRRAWLFREGSLQLLTGDSVVLSLPRQQLTLDFPFAKMFAELDEE